MRFLLHHHDNVSRSFAPLFLPLSLLSQPQGGLPDGAGRRNPAIANGAVPHSNGVGGGHNGFQRGGGNGSSSYPQGVDPRARRSAASNGQMVSLADGNGGGLSAQQSGGDVVMRDETGVRLFVAQVITGLLFYTTPWPSIDGS